MNIRDQVRIAWKEASEDLEIRVTIPLTVYSEKETLEADCFLPDFGGLKGVVFIAVTDFRGPTKRFTEAATKGGFYYSIVNAKVYRSYSREIFIEALKDWGWFGPEAERPMWL